MVLTRLLRQAEKSSAIHPKAINPASII